jgi:hypothetical protein
MGKGNIIGKANEPTASIAAGVWSMREQYAAKRGNAWPSAPAGAATDFTISPAVSGKTSWDLQTDGALNLGTTGEWTIVASRTVTVSAKMWGAGGGPGGQYDAANPPTGFIGPAGGGGYAAGTFQLTSGATYILRVGQGGRRGLVSGLNGSGATHLSGGARASAGGWASEGGGYTGIFATSVTQGNAILMAGGGGGGTDTRYSANGGAGGGTNGQDSSTPAGQGGGGGTQSAGGAASIYNGATAGSALTGGLAQTLHSGGAGGGGGYFGGGGSNVGGGGGGSGRTGTGVTGGTLTAGSAETPGNSADADRAGSGAGGTGSTNGTDGRARIAFVSAP